MYIMQKKDAMQCFNPKGPWVPYVEFGDSRQAAVNSFYF
jgi:hypothetical protein